MAETPPDIQRRIDAGVKALHKDAATWMPKGKRATAENELAAARLHRAALDYASVWSRYAVAPEEEKVCLAFVWHELLSAASSWAAREGEPDEDDG